jgi:hypothetical protein
MDNKPHESDWPGDSIVLFRNPILINIWADCNGRLENNNMQGLENGIENE